RRSKSIAGTRRSRIGKCRFEIRVAAACTRRRSGEPCRRSEEKRSPPYIGWGGAPMLRRRRPGLPMQGWAVNGLAILYREAMHFVLSLRAPQRGARYSARNHRAKLSVEATP